MKNITLAMALLLSTGAVYAGEGKMNGCVLEDAGIYGGSYDYLDTYLNAKSVDYFQYGESSSLKKSFLHAFVGGKKISTELSKAEFEKFKKCALKK